MFWWDLPFPVTGNALTFYERFPLGKTFGFHGSKYSFLGTLKHLCSCRCHSALRTSSCMQGTQYPLFRVSSLMFVFLRWVCSSKCCDDCYVNNFIGFVNVGLLCNTFRVVSPVYHGSRSAKAEAERSFGNVSCESPIDPRSQPTIPSYEHSHRTYNPTRPASNHSRDHSWSSVNSNTELLDAEKASYESIQMKMAPSPLNGITSPQSNTKRQDFDFQSEIMVDVPLGTASLDLHSPRVSFVIGDTRHEPSTQDQQCSIQPMAGTDAPTKGAKVPTFKSRAPVALDLSRISVLSLPLSSRETSNKSATLAARLGIPVASACNPSQTSAVSQVSAFTRIPRIEISNPENVNESNSRPSPSFASAGTDSDSDYSGEIVHDDKVWPLPEVHTMNKTLTIPPPSLQSMRALSQRMTMSSVWSQESGYTTSPAPGCDSELTHNHGFRLVTRDWIHDEPTPGRGSIPAVGS